MDNAYSLAEFMNIPVDIVTVDGRGYNHSTIINFFNNYSWVLIENAERRKVLLNASKIVAIYLPRGV